MSYPVFDWAESPGAQLSEQPRVLESKFGDGYVQTAPDGLNPISQQWRLPFRGVSREAGDAIVAFLRARGGVEYFQWTPLWSTTPILVVCSSWTRSQTDVVGESDIEATFVQRFAP